jgi:DNA invertase Pin-like site-specific DNA recombinase
MSNVGYARISTRSQSDDIQLDELASAGCAKVFADKGVSGKLASRPEWDACLAYLREGDTLVITRLSRAMRSLRDLLNVAHELDGRGIGLRVLKQDIDTTTSAGRLLFHILAAIDEFQRELIVEGTKEGLASARARGRVGGRKRMLSEAQERLALELYDAVGADGKRKHTVEHIAGVLKCSRPTIYAAIERQRNAQHQILT